MSTLILKTETTEEFFKRGKRLAISADRGETLLESRVISFEDPADLIKLISTARLTLLRAVKETPGSIAQLSAYLHRDRSAVKRDVDALAEAGLLTITEKPLPGHGRMKEIRATATRWCLQAEIV